MASTRSSGEGTRDDHVSLERDLESFRTYLLYVAWRLKGQEGVAGAEGASDLVQQTMFVALKKVQEGKGPGPTPKDRRAWLRQILSNLLHEKSRRAERVKGELVEAVVDSATSPSGTLAKHEEIRTMAVALDRLEPIERESIIWKFVDDLSYQEIGRRRGTPIPTPARCE